MSYIESKNWISNFKKRWLIFSLLRIMIFSAGLALIFSTVLTHFLGYSFLLSFSTIGLTVFIVSVWISKVFSISNQDIYRYLNQYFPALEESTALIFESAESLSFLQKLQVSKLNQILPKLPQPAAHLKKLKSVVLFLFVATLLSFLITKSPLRNHPENFSALTSAKAKIVKDIILPEIKELEVQINPPVYTNLNKTNQNQFSLKVAIGSTVKWQITTNTTVKSLKFIFNTKKYVALKPLNKEQTLWGFNKKMNQPGFYQAELDGKKSDLYQIEIIPDLPVAIKILKPAPQSVIDFGQPQLVNLSIFLADDYGINDAYLAATLTSGKGEGVSFKEQKIDFNIAGFGKQITINQQLNLKKLGMKPGDELYFFVKATDNYGQESRSDIYRVAIQDTAELMSLSGMASGVNLVPEYFRSQRQIIIDTEKLLKERASITDVEFKNRSNNLGIDQKLLRLRYGKFLGEESETYGSDATGEKHSADDGHDHGQAAEPKFGDTKALMQEYAHNHDNSEDATFFEPELKAKLKATLSEMWSAELQLRTYQTQQALPFEYKALRLLKDLQQSSRAYVAKTSVKTTPLKLEKRLTGELDKIITPTQNSNAEQLNDKSSTIRKAISILEKLKQQKQLSNTEKKTLNDAQMEVIDAASKNPAQYLSVLKLMRQISSENYLKHTSKEINVIENALQKLLVKQQPLPQSQTGTASSLIGESYFQNLKKLNKQ